MDEITENDFAYFPAIISNPDVQSKPMLQTNVAAGSSFVAPDKPSLLHLHSCLVPSLPLYLGWPCDSNG